MINTNNLTFRSITTKIIIAKLNTKFKINKNNLAVRSYQKIFRFYIKVYYSIRLHNAKSSYKNFCDILLHLKGKILFI